MACYGLDYAHFDLGSCLQDLTRALPIAILGVFGSFQLARLRKRDDRKRYGRRGQLLLHVKLAFVGSALALQVVQLVLAIFSHARASRIAANAATTASLVSRSPLLACSVIASARCSSSRYRSFDSIICALGDRRPRSSSSGSSSFSSRPFPFAPPSFTTNTIAALPTS